MNPPSTPEASARVLAELREKLGLDTVDLHHGLSQKELFAAAVENDRGRIETGGSDDAQKAFATSLGDDGPLVFYTDPTCTGRPVKDTFAVAWPEFRDEVWWKKDFQQFDPEAYEGLLARVVAYLNEKNARLYSTDVFCGWQPKFAIPYRFVGEYATHAHFANIMFPKDVQTDGDRSDTGWTLLDVPSFHTDPDRDGTLSNRAVIIDLKNRIGLVLGRADYSGVVKKTMFTVMNYVLPSAGQLTMHCSANVGRDGDVAILFGLSGTGKTTLSADPDRLLIGDDEHVWTDDGISNFEDGCYAKLIDLDKDDEPVIAAALSRPGTHIENVPPLPDRPVTETDPQEFDLTDDSITENTRFAYPLACNPKVAEGAHGGHPSTIVLLTADAFGVLPPISLLSTEEVLYHFVTGFTSKLAGTEVGVTEPQATFSSCFGAPFMSHRPSVYARLLAERMEQHNARSVLLNTGWSGGRYGVGSRMPLRYTRALLDAALEGRFDDAETTRTSIMGMTIPTSFPGDEVPDEILDPRNTWADGAEFDAAARELRQMFRENYIKAGYAELGIVDVLPPDDPI
ncbi:MAG: phosphoenolpyruvate carboxykinase (ATP) [Acidimicrobiales bacterium]